MQGSFKITNGINLGAQASDPAGGAEGDSYRNSATNKVRVFINGAWRDAVSADDTQTLQNKTLLASNNQVADAVDTTKQIKFQASGATTGTALTIAAAQTAARTLTLPDATDTVVARATSDTLSNKSIVANNSQIVDSVDNTKQVKFQASGATTATALTIAAVQTAARTLTLPDATDTVVARATTDTLSNKSIVANNSQIVDNADNTKQVKFQASGATTGTALTIAAAQTAARTLTLPDATDTIVARATTDTLSNKSIVANNSQVVDSVDSTKQIKFQASGATTGTALTIAAAQTVARTLTLPDATDTLVARATSDTLTNKTFGDAPIFTQIATPTSPSAGLNKLYAKSDNNFYSLSSSGVETKVGASVSNNNYITNYGAEIDTTGWASYSNTAQNTPVTGTGGVATGLTFARSTTSPLDGVGSFLITQANATSLQGKGVSYDFTIDAADQAKVLAVTFNYNGDSNFTAADGTTAPKTDGTVTTNTGNSDIEVFIYDKTNAVLIPVSPFVITGKGSSNYQFKGVFQTASNSTSYRLILHCATASAPATGYNFKFDNVFVGVQSVSYGAPLGDWKNDLTFTFSPGFGTTIANSVYYRLHGDTLYVRGTITAGTVAASVAYIQLPSVFTIDSTKMPTATFGDKVGDFISMIGGVATGIYNNSHINVLFYDGSTTNQIFIAANTGSSNLQKENGSDGFINSNQPCVFHFAVPVVGKSSTVLMSNDTDTRIVAASAQSSAAITTSASGVVNFGTALFDTHGAYSAGTYTVPVSGYYKVTLAGIVQNTLGQELQLNKNGSFYQGLLNTSTAIQSASTIVKCTAGDTLTIVAGNTGGLNASAGAYLPQVTFERLTGPSAIAATESVNARYYASATAISGALATVSWATKDYDSHSGMSSGTYTVPVSGKYHLNAAVLVAGTIALNNTLILELQKNGTVVSRTTEYAGGAVTNMKAVASDIISCVAGDTLRVQISSSATTPSIVASNFDNFFSLMRLGN